MMPEWLEPMAATLTQERFNTADWLFERKFDGIRLLAYKRGAYLRNYMVEFIRLFAPHVRGDDLKQLASGQGENFSI